MNNKTPDIGAESKAQIAQNIPIAIERAVNSYHEFTDDKNSKIDSKDFQNRHTAAKAALAHIELLLKLAAMVDIPDTDNRMADIQKYIDLSRQELEDNNE